MTINSKDFPLWGQFVEHKDEWIGGILEEFPDIFTPEGAVTEITDIRLEEKINCVCFKIYGKNFNEGFNVKYGGISGEQLDPNWIYFNVAMCPGFRIHKK